ncbi:MAG: asparagine synthase (glutamine-hydrolyzing) [Verrucomicrobia bacterium]|nr:asparagine synthase (glutamine-hydrolyzing) [Verrucomicrobiota bacterium]
MCGIAGFIHLNNQSVEGGSKILTCMGELLAHRGPDGEGSWLDDSGKVGLAHRRLAIIDLSSSGAQPMKGRDGTLITLNGEIYNYLELQESLSGSWNFSSDSDTETVLASYDRYEEECVDHLRGMFSFAIWDDRKQRLFCARDRFGIKPFYYATVDDVFYFASEAKALLPVLPDIETDGEAMAEYLTFNFVIGENTLFKGIKQLLPGHGLMIKGGEVRTWRYWDVNYEVDWNHGEGWFQERLRSLLDDSIGVHLRSDVPVGAYLSGGIDSSLMAILAARKDSRNREAFHGRFLEYPGYDESNFAEMASEAIGGNLNIIDITHKDFEENLRKVIYHLDYPVAGPGSFPQYMVSKLAAEKVKVVLGGQGGDEIFGGYARYLLAYFEQCINAAIDGTYKDGNFVVTIESIIPNLGILREYKPMMREFWREGLFGNLEDRYFRLIDRSSDMDREIDWGELDKGRVFESFREIFLNKSNVRKGAYFDHMTHFDFKTLLPALLQVEDRMSMAHGLESRVPFLDHELVECIATASAEVKFSGGNMKHLIKKSYEGVLPDRIVNRRDKMGFPVPLKEWLGNELNGMAEDIFHGMKQRNRPFINSGEVLANFQSAGRFSRKVWSLMSLEIWHQTFHDQASYYKSLIK